ncbi:MAG: DUF1109 domain-containing protein [Haloarcula sp.]
MRLAIDSGKLLYVLGILFAIAALLYFVRDVVFGLSITVKSALLLLGFIAFFVAGIALERDVLDIVAFALSGVTYSVQTNESVTVSVPESEQEAGGYVPVTRRIGTVTASNPSPFLRALDLPSLSGCLVSPTDSPRERVRMNVDSRWDEDTISGAATTSYDITAELPVDTNQTEPRTYAIERDISCSAQRSEPTIAIAVDGSERFD